MADLTPAQLWWKAEEEHPIDVEARRRRYRELMAEHGLLIPSSSRPLPCGYDRRR